MYKHKLGQLMKIKTMTKEEF